MNFLLCTNECTVKKMHWHKYVLDKVLYIVSLENTNLCFSSLLSVAILSLCLSMGLSGRKTDASTDGAILRIQRPLGKEQMHAMIFLCHKCIIQGNNSTSAPVLQPLKKEGKASSLLFWPTVPIKMGVSSWDSHALLLFYSL